AFAAPSSCQHCLRCSPEGKPALKSGDLAEVQGKADSEGMYCKITEARSESEFLVQALHQGTERQLVLKPSQLRSLSSDGLQKCGACKSVYFCSRECQRAAWKYHKPFCAAASSSWDPAWTEDRAELLQLRARFESPSARQ
ncbi:unnamed protein product, partial [Polarella glacialis]